MVLERQTQPLFIFKQRASPVPRFGPPLCMLIAQPDREALSGCLTAGSSLKVERCVQVSGAEELVWCLVSGRGERGAGGRGCEFGNL